MLAGQIALVLAAAFAGAAFYINFAEQPARLGLDDKNLLAQWKPSYAAGFTMQASLAVVSGVLGLLAAWLNGDWSWVVGALGGAASRRLIVHWGTLHALRTGLGIAATLAYLWALNFAGA
jgi:uncharacterized membrane-anchored protein